MTITPTLFLHIAGGIVGLISGWIALFTRKGGRLHRKAGVVFGISMLIMAASGGYISLLRASWLNVLAGTFTFYLVLTAWLTVKRKQQELGRAEYALLALGLAVGIGGWLLAARMPNPGTAIAFRVFGTVALLACAGDIRMLLRGGLSGAPRLARHLWRMCIALFIATASFLVGRAGDPVLRKTGLRARLFDSIRDTHVLEIPVILVLLLTVFWLIRVRFARAYRKAPAGV
jgi:uncharacterized membrane protein